MSSEAGGLREMPALQRAALRQFTLGQLHNPTLASAARKTLATLDAIESEENAAARALSVANVMRTSALTGEARMIAEFEAAQRAKADAHHRAQELITPKYVVEQLLKAVGLVVLMAVTLFTWMVLGSPGGGNVGLLILIAFPLGSFLLYRRSRSRSAEPPNS